MNNNRDTRDCPDWGEVDSVERESKRAGAADNTTRSRERRRELDWKQKRQLLTPQESKEWMDDAD